jgi:hypothetical protein
VNYAFGPHFSFVLLGADFITYVIDLAIYPCTSDMYFSNPFFSFAVLFVDYLKYVNVTTAGNVTVALSDNWAVTRFVPLGVFGLCLVLNIAGIDVVCIASIHS